MYGGGFFLGPFPRYSCLFATAAPLSFGQVRWEVQQAEANSRLSHNLLLLFKSISLCKTGSFSLSGGSFSAGQVRRKSPNRFHSLRLWMQNLHSQVAIQERLHSLERLTWRSALGAWESDVVHDPRPRRIGNMNGRSRRPVLFGKFAVGPVP